MNEKRTCLFFNSTDLTVSYVLSGTAAICLNPG